LLKQQSRRGDDQKKQTQPIRLDLNISVQGLRVGKPASYLERQRAAKASWDISRPDRGITGKSQWLDVVVAESSVAHSRRSRSCPGCNFAKLASDLESKSGFHQINNSQAHFGITKWVTNVQGFFIESGAGQNIENPNPQGQDGYDFGQSPIRTVRREGNAVGNATGPQQQGKYCSHIASGGSISHPYIVSRKEKHID
jgi:hypothetical protein